MDLREGNRLVRETIEFPVQYDNKQQAIRDSKGMMVCDMRGWERMHKKEKSEELQNAIGEKIAELLNEFEEDPKDDNDAGFDRNNIFHGGNRVELFEWD